MAATSPHAVIVRNPGARRAPTEDALWHAAGPLRDAGWNVDLHTTAGPGDAARLATEARKAGADTVVACGGDGTVHEVANGLSESLPPGAAETAGKRTALAVAPAGTADVWAREAMIPRDFAAALALLPHARRMRADLGTVNGRRFLLMCGVGLDADAVRRVDRQPLAKRWLGRTAYARAGLAAALRTQPGSVELSIDGRSESRDLWLLIAGNTRLYGGVLRLTDAAKMDDGLLDLCLFHGRGGLLHRALLGARALRGGLHRRAGGGIDYVRASRVEITAPEPLPVQADGEYVGETPVTLGVAPGAIDVLIAPRPNPLFGATDGLRGSD